MKILWWFIIAVFVICVVSILTQLFFGKRKDISEDRVPDDRYPLW